MLCRVTKSKKTPQLTLKEFHTFLNSQQRDPRLNEILYPFVSRDNASKIIAKYENGKSGEKENSQLPNCSVLCRIAIQYQFDRCPYYSLKIILNRGLSCIGGFVHSQNFADTDSLCFRSAELQGYDGVPDEWGEQRVGPGALEPDSRHESATQSLLHQFLTQHLPDRYSIVICS